MITKKQATNLKHGDILHHTIMKNADGTPLRCRVNGICKVWKTRPDDFKLPVKYGLKQCFYISHIDGMSQCDSKPSAWVIT